MITKEITPMKQVFRLNVQSGPLLYQSYYEDDTLNIEDNNMIMHKGKISNSIWGMAFCNHIW